MCEITVFTPAYNRSYCLPNLYKSLLAQTFFDFEWVVVDDGSNDDTEERMQNFIAEQKISIIYKKVINGGKHRAINEGVKLASGRLFFIVDSDDQLPSDSLERNLFWENSIQNKTTFAGVAGCCGNKEGNIIGTSFIGDYVDATVLNREQHQIMGDKAEVLYTALLKRYPFPCFENENFLSESAVWLQLAKDGYQFRWFNEITYYAEYLMDGLTAKGNLLFQKNPKGFLYTTKMEASCYPYDTVRRMKLYVAYYDTLRKQGHRISTCARDLNVSTLKLYVWYMLYRAKSIVKKFM